MDAAHVESLGEAAVDLEARAVDVTGEECPNGLRSWTAASKPASAFSPAVRSVEMYPGQTQLTVTPSQPSSAARDRVKPSSACLDAQYAGWPVRPTWLIMEPTLMMRPQPCRCICTAASCANGPNQVAIENPLEGRGAQCVERLPLVDAGVVHQDVEPTVAMAARQASSSPTSKAMTEHCAEGLVCSSAALAASRLRGLEPCSTTVAPCLASITHCLTC